jgi:hypothetical protein
VEAAGAVGDGVGAEDADAAEAVEDAALEAAALEAVAVEPGAAEADAAETDRGLAWLAPMVAVAAFPLADAPVASPCPAAPLVPPTPPAAPVPFAPRAAHPAVSVTTLTIAAAARAPGSQAGRRLPFPRNVTSILPACVRSRYRRPASPRSDNRNFFRNFRYLARPSGVS